MINNLTRKLVIHTARRHPREAKQNGNAFLSKLQAAYTFYISIELLIPLKFRAMELMQVFNHEHFDEEGFLNDWEIEEALSIIINRVTDRIISRPDSPFHLTEYGTLPNQIACPKVPQDIRRYYQYEHEWCIAQMVKHQTIRANTLVKRLNDMFSPIPPNAAEHIVSFAVNNRKESPTIGLPLFEIIN